MKINMAVRSWSVQLVKDKYNMCVCTSVKVFEINLYGTRNNKNNKTSRKKNRMEINETKWHRKQEKS